MKVTIINNRVDVRKASKLLGLSVLSLQGALINRALPLGGAWKNEGSDCFSYYVGKHQLGEFLGITKEELEEELEKIKL